MTDNNGPLGLWIFFLTILMLSWMQIILHIFFTFRITCYNKAGDRNHHRIWRYNPLSSHDYLHDILSIGDSDSGPSFTALVTSLSVIIAGLLIILVLGGIIVTATWLVKSRSRETRPSCDPTKEMTAVNELYEPSNGVLGGGDERQSVREKRGGDEDPGYEVIKEWIMYCDALTVPFFLKSCLQLNTQQYIKYMEPNFTIQLLFMAIGSNFKVVGPYYWHTPLTPFCKAKKWGLAHALPTAMFMYQCKHYNYICPVRMETVCDKVIV